MERLAGPDEGVRTELARLNAELEQALVAVEDAQKEVTLLARQRDALAATDAELRAARAKSEASRQTAEEVATTLREQLAVALSTLAGRQANEMAESARDEELGVALEEAQTLAEELQVANDALLTSNQELQRRVEIEAAAPEEAQSRLFQAQKLEAIGQLTGGIAHDFNNLLTVITGSTQFLRHTDNPERRGHLLRRIEEAAWRGADLTRRLLAFGRRQPLHPDRVDLGVQAVGLTELLRHTLREDIQIQMQFDTA